MVEWFLANAGDLKDLIGLVILISPIAFWVVRRVMISTKQLQQVLAGYSKLATGLDEIRSQLKPNGGTSMFDLLSENTKATNQNAKQITTIAERLSEVRAYQLQASEILAAGPVWHTDADGNCTRVNLEYAALAERTPAELTGAGWENFVHVSDRARVSAEWADAVKKRRAFEAEFVVQSKGGRRFKVRAAATPVVKEGGEVVGYLGRYHGIEPVS